MIAPDVFTAETVTVRATYDCTYWPDVCERCGAEVRVLAAGYYSMDGTPAPYPATADDVNVNGGDAYCPTCGHIPAREVSPPANPAQWGGWCDPANPWGTTDDTYRPDSEDPAYGASDPIGLALPIGEAIEFLREFPGAIWDTAQECEASPNYRTGVDTRVMAHVDGPLAPLALALAGIE
jgi:hypothetical protein